MKFDLSIDSEMMRFKERIKYLLAKSSKVDLTQLREVRTIKQNSYLHVVITLYAIEFGYTLNEAKTDLKRLCSFMIYEKNGSKYLKESKKLNTKELTTWIDWIRNYASQNGLYIPDAEEYKLNKFSIDRDIEKCKQYL